MHDLDNLLAGADGFGDGLTGRLFLNGFDEVARNRQGDVSLQQGDADLTQGGGHVFLGQRTLTGQLFKHT